MLERTRTCFVNAGRIIKAGKADLAGTSQVLGISFGTRSQVADAGKT